jgi:hypothetical protein
MCHGIWIQFRRVSVVVVADVDDYDDDGVDVVCPNDT